MFTFTIVRTSATNGQVTRHRDNLTLEQANNLYQEAISKAHKVIDRNDEVEANADNRICFARLESGTAVYHVEITEVKAITV